MLFTSIIYFLFLACVLLLYYIIPPKYRNYLLIAASAFFYMYADMGYIVIIIFLIIANYLLGIQLQKTTEKKMRARYLQLALLVNIGTLVFFKYWNFLIENIFGSSDRSISPILSRSWRWLCHLDYRIIFFKRLVM